MKGYERIVLAALAAALVACGAAGSMGPREPRSDERACEEDSDCVFRPEDPCGCAPCGTAWRRAVNERTAGELLAGGTSCEPAECPDCTTEWRGTEPVCVEGQCRVRHAR